MAGKRIKLTALDQVEIRAALTTALRHDRENLASALKVGALDSVGYYTKTTVRQANLLEMLMTADDIMVTVPEGWGE